MATTVKVEYTPECPSTNLIRSLICNHSRKTFPEGYNALVESEFNTLLQEIAQDAFNNGRRFEREAGTAFKKFET